MIANKLVFIQLSGSQSISSIREQRGQVIYDKTASKIYIDTYNLGRMLTTKIVVTDLFDTVGSDKLYYKPLEDKFYTYNTATKTYTQVEYLTEVIHLIEPIKKYRSNTLTLDVKTDGQTKTTQYLAPVTLSNLVYRPTGENLEVYLRGLLNQEKDSELYTSIITDSNTSYPMPIPVPYDKWYVNGGSGSIYVDGVYVHPDNYIIDEAKNTVSFNDFPTGLPSGSKVEFTFFNTVNRYQIHKNRFITQKNQTVFKLDFPYTIGINAVEVHINGIKQPNECYTETSPTVITLKDTVPENSEVVIQYGKLVESTPEFYSDFESRTISAKVNNKVVTTYPKNIYGQIRTIEETFDSNNRVILRIAKLNNVEVKRETLVYKTDGSVVITAE